MGSTSVHDVSWMLLNFFTTNTLLEFFFSFFLFCSYNTVLFYIYCLMMEVENRGKFFLFK